MTSSQGPYGGNDERVLVLLPESRDAESIPRVLEVIGVPSMVCSTQGELCAEIHRGVGVVMIEEEALSPRVGACLHATLESQHPWSELPIIILSGPEPEVALNALLLPGDVTLVERPVRVNTLVTIVRSALRSRRRQYQMRDQLLALEQSESRYRTLFNSIDEGFCTIEVIFDENDKPVDYLFLEVNPAFATQAGWANAQGKRMSELGLLEQHWLETYGGVALTGRPVRFSRRVEPLSRWFDVYAFRIGRPEERHVAILFSDITRRKQKEDKIKKLNAALAERAAELDAANRELEAFSHTVAHDLRQPLNVLSMLCQSIELLCGDKIPEECIGYVKDAYTTTLKMDRLIGSMLNFSRLGNAEPSREMVDLGMLAHEIANELQVSQPERQVDFKIADKIMANADANLLRIVLNNLLGNAWKYTGMREKGVIEFGVNDLDGVQTYFVRDNGAGFDMAEAGKLFTLFKRLPGAEKQSGFGIGLATVERIIKKHGGKVWAEGEPDKGACFCFTLGEK